MNNLQFQSVFGQTSSPRNGVAWVQARSQSLIISSSFEPRAPPSGLQDVPSHFRCLNHHAAFHGTSFRRPVLGCGVRPSINGRSSTRVTLSSAPARDSLHRTLFPLTTPVALCLPSPLSAKAQFREGRPLPLFATIHSEP